MNKQQKLIAYIAINGNITDTTARQIVRYVMECELWNQDTVSPTNEHLAQKYKWTVDTVKVAISKAKKSQFITTTGYGKKRCLELNVSFLKGKMAEAYQKTLKPKVDFSDVLPEPPNTLPNTLPNTFSSKNGLTKGEKAFLGGYNNNNNNNNNMREQSSRGEQSKYNPLGSELIKSFETINPACKKMYGNTTQREACDNLITEYTFERVKTVIEQTLPETNVMDFFPNIITPDQLWKKWAALEAAVLKFKIRKKEKSRPKTVSQISDEIKL